MPNPKPDPIAVCEQLVECICEEPGCTSERLCQRLGLDRDSDLLPFCLGMLEGRERIFVQPWEGTNSEGQACHKYWPRED